MAASEAPDAGASVAASDGPTLPVTAARVVNPDSAVTAGKRALARRWTFISGSPDPENPRDWSKKLMVDIATVGTAEDIIATLGAMEPPSEVVGRADGFQLFMFQEGARPDWKDPLVKSKGGRWDLPLRYTSDPADVLAGAEEPSQLSVHPDDVWRRILFAVASESLEEAAEVVGVAVERKRDKDSDMPGEGPAWMYRIAVWVQTASDLSMQTRLGESLRALLDLPEESLAFFSFLKADRNINPRITI